MWFFCNPEFLCCVNPKPSVAKGHLTDRSSQKGYLKRTISRLYPYRRKPQRKISKRTSDLLSMYAITRPSRHEAILEAPLKPRRKEGTPLVRRENRLKVAAMRKVQIDQEAARRIADDILEVFEKKRKEEDVEECQKSRNAETAEEL